MEFSFLHIAAFLCAKDRVSNELKIMDETEVRGSRTPKTRRSHKTKNSEQTHYYPFGLKHEVYTSPIVLTHKATPEPNIVKPGYALETEYQYKYNGKEWQDELGLNMYAMDMRQYDPAIARWVVHDPIVHHSMSPYNAFDGNPVFWADPSGGEVYTPAQHEWNQKFENSIYDGNNGIDAFSAFNGNFWQFHPFDKKSGATEANGNQNRETDPPGKRITQIIQLFKYDKNQLGAKLPSGTDYIRQTEITVTHNINGEGKFVTTTITNIITVSINSKGEINKNNISQIVFVHTAINNYKGDIKYNNTTGSTTLKFGDLSPVMQNTTINAAKEKSIRGHSPLQNRANNISSGINVVVGAGAGVATGGASLGVQLATGVTATIVADKKIKVNPENLYKKLYIILPKICTTG